MAKNSCSLQKDVQSKFPKPYFGFDRTWESDVEKGDFLFVLETSQMEFEIAFTDEGSMTLAPISPENENVQDIWSLETDEQVAEFYGYHLTRLQETRKFNHKTLLCGFISEETKIRCSEFAMSAELFCKKT